MRPTLLALCALSLSVWSSGAAPESIARTLLGASPPAPPPLANPLPDTPPAAAAPPASGPRPVPPGTPSIVLREVRLEGGAGLPKDELAAVYQPFLGYPVTLADLEEIRYRLTQRLVERGYVNSGAVLEDQTVADGSVRFRLIAGQLEDIQISGQGRLRAAYLRDRLRPRADRPFNRAELEERFQLLLEDPLIDNLQGTLWPGSAPGRAVLDLRVARARPWEFYLRTDNHRPPSTGAERAYFGGTLRNLTGYGDALDGYFGIDYQGASPEGELRYSLPLNGRDTRLWVRWSRNDSALIESPLADLDIESATQRIEVGLTQPLWNTLNRQLTLGVLLAWGENRTWLLDERFSFSPGVVEGEHRVSAVRFVQEYRQRAAGQAFSLRSVFSYGLEAFDATRHRGNEPDSRFFAWLGQGSYVRQLNDRDWRLIARGAVQLAGERLLPLEQLAIGGINTVRGYRENEQVNDSGYAATLELRVPLWRGAGFADLPQMLEAAFFGDVGAAWRHDEFSAHDTLWSAGVGLNWLVAERFRAELYWAHPFEKPLPTATHNAQDDGLHFMAQWNF